MAEGPVERFRNVFSLVRAAPSREKFALLRIHKTGSQSFRAAFRTCFRKSEDAGLNFGGDVTLKGLEGKRFVSPHMTVEEWLTLAAGSDWMIGITLREPRARLRSAYRYFRQKPDTNPTGVGERLRGMDYAGFLASGDPVLCGLKDNVIAAFVGGGHFGRTPKGRNQVSLPDGMEMGAAAETARQRLEAGLVMPLILEESAASTRAACARLGIARPPAVGWRNRSRSAAVPAISVTDAILELENACLKHDFAVYRTACEVLGRNAVMPDG